ncbi:MAG: hypothetical protein ACFFE8_09230 [Candidatus Heimdallarchaeota archaeon]
MKFERAEESAIRNISFVTAITNFIRVYLDVGGDVVPHSSSRLNKSRIAVRMASDREL